MDDGQPNGPGDVIGKAIFYSFNGLSTDNLFIVQEQRYWPFIKLSLSFLIVLLVGTVGYHAIESNWSYLEALYMTIITITTVGFREVKLLTPRGQVFTIFIIFLGIGMVTTLFARLGQIIVESGVKNLYGRRKMTDRMKRMRNHYLLCGFGRTGSSIARKLNEAGIDFVIIDSLQEHIDDATSLGYSVLKGDASSDSILLDAGIQKARGTVLCVGDDVTNVNIALAARELNNEQNIISRGTNPSLEYRLVRAGADSVVYPMRLGGEQIARSIAQEYTKDTSSDRGSSSSMLGYELRIIRNTEEARAVQDFMEEYQALRPVAIRKRDGDMSHNPTPEDIVEENDSLLLLINEEKRNREKQEIARLEWTEDINIGFTKIDKEHKRLYRIAADLQAAVLDSSDSESIARCYELLTTFSDGHFHREEVLMRENGYPGLEEHQLQHEELSRQLAGLYSKDRFHVTDDTWNQIDRWFTQHFLSDDKVFADYLKN